MVAFQSKEVKDYLTTQGIHHHRVTPLRSQANGKVEGFMKPMGKAIRAAWAEGRDWQRELFAFFMNYRTTPHLSTGVAPAEMLYKRVFRSTVPSFSQEAPWHTAAKRVLKLKAKSKQYVDARRRTRKSTIKEGHTVLVKQKKKNKVTAQSGDHVNTRNVSHFKKFSGAYRETVPNPQSEDDVTIAATQAGQDNDQDIIENRYPLRAKRGVPPDFYGR
ncbi:PREDICTED: uncharacterized protein K02A2.6-like [Paramuricea clavata]|uniref:PREDICTED: uncharacterized protein K02A2.6-like n=1 Tax=Paramuricea clavata TaxID=317549 RepID=A0A7D9EA82_PARCT|nr:PREDICTED: uncharacterized protein K02A2.6-like [Paramuricea clavata]